MFLVLSTVPPHKAQQNTFTQLSCSISLPETLSKWLRVIVSHLSGSERAELHMI